MSTKYLKSLTQIKKSYPLLHDELKEIFKNNNKSLKNFDLDYFAIKSDTNEFYLSMASFAHSTESNITFDMKGEILEDEIAIFDHSFSSDESTEDLYDTERQSYCDDEDEDDEEY
jgi:hypothetical protein